MAQKSKSQRYTSRGPRGEYNPHLFCFCRVAGISTLSNLLCSHTAFSSFVSQISPAFHLPVMALGPNQIIQDSHLIKRSYKDPLCLQGNIYRFWGLRTDVSGVGAGCEKTGICLVQWRQPKSSDTKGKSERNWFIPRQLFSKSLKQLTTFFQL